MAKHVVAALRRGRSGRASDVATYGDDGTPLAFLPCYAMRTLAAAASCDCWATARSAANIWAACRPRTCADVSAEAIAERLVDAPDWDTADFVAVDDHDGATRLIAPLANDGAMPRAFGRPHVGH